ncbi:MULTISPECIES: hypothetical protein [Thalassospira]|uniref:hypothetical protein n=1 Tax=Thalassospira TaxID=168934 RepID=UPI002101A150|nr:MULTISPECIES: hypothetical protein [Thalassospira]
MNQEEMHNNIRCCCISPGEVATPILDQRPVRSKKTNAPDAKTRRSGDMVAYVVAARHGFASTKSSCPRPITEPFCRSPKTQT